jgi:hypothetical protein
LCVENYRYCSELAYYLCEEYTHRYNNIHTCKKHIDWLKSNTPLFQCEKDTYINCKKPVVLSYNKTFQELGHTPVPLAMYDDVKYPDTFKSYRMYYIVYKRGFARCTQRPVPWWYTSGNFVLFKKINECLNEEL